MRSEAYEFRRQVSGASTLSYRSFVEDDDENDDEDSFVESPGTTNNAETQTKSAWISPCKCPQHDLSLDNFLENRLDVDLLSPNGCRVDRPKTKRRWALWVAGAVLFVSGLAFGFCLGGPLAPSFAAGHHRGGSGGERSVRHGPVLVYSSDDDQQAGVIASIRSVQMHASGPVEFLYIGNSPLPGMEDMPQVRFRKLSLVVKKYRLEQFTNPTYQRGGKNAVLNTEPANFVRFVVHDLLPKQDKAMWIDADTIVECDVVELFRNTFNDGGGENDGHDALLKLPAVAAVPREGYPIGLSGRGRRAYGDEEISFNAGIYLMELNR